MGAMKAIYTDIQELQDAATGDEDSFITYVEDNGWTSPTENEMRAAKASKLLAGMPPGKRAMVLRCFDTVGVKIPTLDFPIRGAGEEFRGAGEELGGHAPAA